MVVDVERQSNPEFFLDGRLSVLGDRLNIGRDGEGGVKDGIPTSGL